MSSSRSFDRAASFYDQTRPLPEPVAKDGIQAILDIIGIGSRVLEVGVGTGRISIPLLARGVDLIGCDLSSKMLKRLQEKSRAARIVQADATYLPFPRTTFDFVLTVHVLHLIPPWQNALREFQRVLTPAGAYLNVKTWGTVGVSIREQIRLHWRRWLAEHGVNAGLPGVQGSAELTQELQSMGAQIAELDIVHYPLAFTLRQELERFQARIFSDAWDIPDDIFNASLQELWSWVESEYGNLDQPLQDELRFVIDVARF